jgi:predicted phosphoribosyltransferase
VAPVDAGRRPVSPGFKESMMRYRNRIDAGRELARHLTTYASRSDVVVLGLPRGGVPVAAEVAARLRAPLDVFLVRKIGVPEHPELAMGALAEGGIKVLSNRLIRDLGIPAGLVERVTARERLELDRRDVCFRAGRKPQPVAGRTVILVDDGLATGLTMEAAIAALREQQPSQIIVATPVGAREACARLSTVADDVVCPLRPDPFSAVGMWYDDFAPTDDDEVRRLLRKPDVGKTVPAVQ